jgi:hypothetical protein
MTECHPLLALSLPAILNKKEKYMPEKLYTLLRNRLYTISRNGLCTLLRNIQSSKILGNQWELRIYEYVADSNYVGSDKALIRAERGSDGASPNDEIEDIIIYFQIVEQ